MNIAENFEGISFTDDDLEMGWTLLARDFVFQNLNPRALKFIKKIQLFKVEAEEELKQKIERRILLMRENRLGILIGRELAKKMKSYI